MSSVDTKSIELNGGNGEIAALDYWRVSRYLLVPTHSETLGTMLLTNVRILVETICIFSRANYYWDDRANQRHNPITTQTIKMHRFDVIKSDIHYNYIKLLYFSIDRHGGFLSHRGTPSHHPFIDGIFHEKPTIWGVPPFMESRIWDLRYVKKWINVG